MTRLAIAAAAWFAWVLAPWFCTGTVFAGFAGGTGKLDDPYQIATAEQLISIGSNPNLLNKHFVLLNDIDVDPNLPGGRAFVRAVIAPNLSDEALWKGVPFKGSLDGRGCSIKHLSFQTGIVYYIGLFGGVGKEALIFNLKVEDADLDQQYGWFQSVLAARNEGRIVQCQASGRVSGTARVGVLAGENTGSIIDCQADGEVYGLHSVGGLVGANVSGTIMNSHATSRVVITGPTDFNWGGGLVGCSSGGVIVNCSATGDICGATGNYLGGLVGDGDAAISNCYSTGNISIERGGCMLGGLAGEMGGSINDCYATGKVSTGGYSDSLGGLVGYVYGFVLNSYAAGRVSAGEGSKHVGGLVGFEEPRGDVEACF